MAVCVTAVAQHGPGRRAGGMSSGVRPARDFGGQPGHRFGGGPGFGFDGELELGFSINEFSGSDYVYRPDRLGLYGEFRVDLGGYADMGLQLTTTFGKGQLLHYMEDTWYWQGAALVVGDFNVLPYSIFNPYVGLGIGPGIGYKKNKDLQTSEWIHSVVLAPRIGIELFERLRMTVQYQWYLNDDDCFSHFAFGLGWTFGPDSGMRRPMR